MSDKDKVVIDGRTGRQIISLYHKDVKQLTDNQWEWAKENASVKKRDGGMVKGFSPIARPQRFKGVF